MDVQMTASVEVAEGESFRFEVALSFAGGEQRPKVRAIAELLVGTLGDGKVFFDEWFEAELAGQDTNTVLQAIYRKSSRLVVTFISQGYAERPWTQDEWRAVQAFERSLRDAGTGNVRRLRFLPLRLADGEVDGLFDTAFVPDVRDRSPEHVAELILDRLRLIQGRHVRTAPRPAGRPKWIVPALIIAGMAGATYAAVKLLRPAAVAYGAGASATAPVAQRRVTAPDPPMPPAAVPTEPLPLAPDSPVSPANPKPEGKVPTSPGSRNHANLRPKGQKVVIAEQPSNPPPPALPSPPPEPAKPTCTLVPWVDAQGETYFRRQCTPP